MGQLEFKCVCCDTSIEVGKEQVGFVVYCPNCMAELIVPELIAETEPDHPTPPPTPTPYRSNFAEKTPSQIIYRDADGNPLIPEEFSQAFAQGNEPQTESLTDTKIALADTLRQLQEHQSALAEARRELARKQDQLSETNRAILTETTNQLLAEQQREVVFPSPAALPTPTDIYGPESFGDTRNVTMNFDENSDTAEIAAKEIYKGLQPPELDLAPASGRQEGFPKTDTEMLRERAEAVPQYSPLYTPYGEFMPFSEDDLNNALQYESPELRASLEAVQAGGHCWSYNIFGILLESHVNTNLPDDLYVQPLQTVLFGTTSRYMVELTKQQVIFLNIVRRMTKPLSEQFQHALQYHDIHAFSELLSELDNPLHELHQFMHNFQKLQLPKKAPFPIMREIFLDWYVHIRYQLLTIADRLYERSQLTPEQALRGTISISLLPPTIHRFNHLLKKVPSL